MKQHQSSPSLDGQSTQYYLGGSSPYSNVLFHRQVASSTKAMNYQMDMDLYVDNPQNSQGMEFAVLQSTPGKWYKFSTQCAFSTKQWRIWDGPAHHWVATSAPCNQLPARSWNHLTFEYARTSDGHTHFIAVTVNGHRYFINAYARPQTTSWNNYSLATHFQMDGNRNQASYSVWIDRMTIKYW